MKRWKVLLSLALLSLSFTSKAAHFVSGEMEWKHLGNRIFDVYVTYYNDCYAYATKFPFSLHVDKSSGYITKNVDNYTIDTIDYFPDNCVSNLCQVQTYKRMYRTRGRFRVNLSNDTSCSYHFYIDDCCRNSYITNIVVGSSGVIYMRLEGTVTLCGVDTQYWSSPQFISPVQPNASAGGFRQVSFLCSDTVNGFDSVAYELINPADGGNAMQYSAGYSYTAPLTYNGYPINNALLYGTGYSLDSRNGQLIFSPMLANQSTCTAVKVKSYRKKNSQWVLATEMTRDMMLHAQNATINRFPYFVQPLEDLYFCDSNSTFYDFQVADSNSADSLSIRIYGKVPSYSLQLLKHQGLNWHYRLNFSLDSTARSQRRYDFVIEVIDNSCNGTTFGANQHSMTLFTTVDTSLLADLTLTKERVCNGVSYTLNNVPSNVLANWSINGSTNYKRQNWVYLALDSTYYISYVARQSGCVYTYKDTLIVDSLYHFNGSISGFPTKTCVGQEMNLSWTVSGGLGDYRYFLNGNPATNTMTISANDSIYVAYVMDSSGCRIDTSINLQLFQELGSQAKQRINLCRENAQPFFVSSLPVGGAGGYQTTWNWSTPGDSFLVNTDTLQQLHYRIEDSVGCFFEDTLRFNIRAKPNYILVGNETHCYGDSFHLAVRHNFDTALVRFNWMNSWVKDSTYTIAPSQDSILYIQMRDTGNCTIVDQFSLNYHQGRLPKLADSIVYCQGDSLTLSNGFIGLYDTVTWTYLNRVENQPNVTLGANQAYSLKLRVVDEDACIYLDSTYVSSKKKPDIYLLMADTRWCENDQAFSLNDSVVQSGGVWRIDGVMDSVANPSVLSYGDHALTYELDSNGCKAISYQVVRIRKLPQVDFVVQNPQGNGPLQSKFIPAILADTAYALHWDFGDPATTADTSSQDTSTYSYNTKGFYSPSLVVRTAYCSTTLEKDSAVQVYQGVGLNGIDNKLRIYPNPGKGIYHLQTGLLKVNSIRVYTSLGQEIYLQNQVPEDNTTFTFDLGSLSPGIYTLLVRTNENEFYTIKLIHQP